MRLIVVIAASVGCAGNSLLAIRLDYSNVVLCLYDRWSAVCCQVVAKVNGQAYSACEVARMQVLNICGVCLYALS